MKTMFGRLTKDSAAVLFYVSLLTGNFLFAGGKAAAVLTLFLLLTNGILRVSTGAFMENGSDYLKHFSVVESLNQAGLPATRNDLRHMGVDYLFWGDDERRYFKFDPDLPVMNRIGSTVLYSLVQP